MAATRNNKKPGLTDNLPQRDAYKLKRLYPSIAINTTLAVFMNSKVAGNMEAKLKAFVLANHLKDAPDGLVILE